ncbi:MAG: hypothetical protein DWQ01_21175 [Planctomycetota bacterium]|nr:MAG: hypothetical protein DWQ01_21175 [Planctomycetota bacterium]
MFTTASALLLLATFPQQPVLTGLGQPGDQYGWAVSGIGDVNRDGFPDLAVGAVQTATTEGPAAGYVHVLSGQDGRTLLLLEGQEDHDEFGIAVSGAGDVNRDGVPDILVGARFANGGGTSFGEAKVFSGHDGQMLLEFHGHTRFSEFGRSVASAGDVDQDGYPDLIVGAPKDDNVKRDVGSAYVLSGRDASTLFVLSGDRSQDGFGYSVSGVGDLNRDGYADFAVGAPHGGSRGEGQVSIYSGRDASQLFLIEGPASGSAFGTAVAGAGDVNLDGIPDWIAGAIGDDTKAPGSGMAMIVSGRDGAVLHRLFGEREATFFGASVSGLGDVDGDGYADVAVGAPRDEEAGANAGKVQIFSGLGGHVIKTYLGQAEDQLGLSLSGAGDLDGDGMPELAIGAPFSERNGPQSGAMLAHAPGAGVQPANAQQFALAGAPAGGVSSLSSGTTNYYYYNDDAGWYGWYGYPWYPPCGTWTCWHRGYCYCCGWPYFAYGYCWWICDDTGWRGNHNHGGGNNNGGGNNQGDGPFLAAPGPVAFAGNSGGGSLNDSGSHFQLGGVAQEGGDATEGSLTQVGQGSDNGGESLAGLSTVPANRVRPELTPSPWRGGSPLEPTPLGNSAGRPTIRIRGDGLETAASPWRGSSASRARTSPGPVASRGSQPNQPRGTSNSGSSRSSQPSVWDGRRVQLPSPQVRTGNRSASRPQVQSSSRPASRPQVQSRSRPTPRPQVQTSSRPAPRPKVQSNSRPAPQPRPAVRPSTSSRPRPSVRPSSGSRGGGGGSKGSRGGGGRGGRNRRG